MTSPEYIEYDQGKGRIPPAKAFSRAVSSEFKRLTTQRWFKWALPLMVLAPVLMEWFIAATNKSLFDADIVENSLGANALLSGVRQPGMLFVWIISVLAVTSDYSSGHSKINFSYFPSRWMPAVAKFLVVTAIVIAAMLLAFLLSTGTYKLTAPDELWSNEDFKTAATMMAKAALVHIPLTVALMMGLSHLIRSSVASLFVCIGWPIAESIAPMGLDSMRHVAPFAPFRNLRNWTWGGEGLFTEDSSELFAHGGIWPIVYFAAVALTIAAISLYVVRRRDA